MLTEGAIEEILSKPVDQHPQKPVFQILGIKKIQTKGNDGAASDRYRLVLSDGIHLYTSAMLATQLNDLVVSKQVEVKAVVQLDKFVCNTIQGTRRVLIVLELTVIKPGNEVAGRLGCPKNINDNSSSDRQPHQNGSSAEHSMSGNTVMSSGPVGAASRGAGLASATYGSHQPQDTKSENSKPVYPIMSLTPYQNRWTIRARVTSKSNVRTWSNSKGEGRVFNVDLVDESGEIRATGFNDVVDKFYEMLEVNKVFYFSKCSLRTANKQYSSLKNDYEMYLNNDSIVEPCNDASNLPTIQYNFIQISDLINCNADTLVDILGIVVSCDDVTSITTRTTNRQVSKRDVTLLDRSEKSVRVTLWGDDAEKFEEHVGKNPVLALKGVRVSEFGGRTLSVLNSTNMRVNPMEVKEACSLRGWYDNVGINSNVESLSGQRGEGGGMGSNYKTFYQVKAENLGNGDKADYVTVRATVVYMKRDNCLYKACPSAECNKKVIEEGENSFRCEKCNKTYPNYKYRLLLQSNLADFTGDQWVTCFQESAENILNTTADNLGQLKDSGAEQAFDDVFSAANFKQFVFKVRVKMETYNDEARLKWTAVNVAPVDFKQESRRLMAEIKKLRML